MEDLAPWPAPGGRRGDPLALLPGAALSRAIGGGYRVASRGPHPLGDGCGGCPRRRAAVLLASVRVLRRVPGLAEALAAFPAGTAAPRAARADQVREGSTFEEGVGP